MNSLDGKKVVVIGGTSGIGLATAVLAQNAGAQVWAASRTKEKVDQCNADHPEIQFSQLDIHDAQGITTLLESIGTVDHIVACATGADRTMAPFMQQTDEQFRGAFEKFWGYTNVARNGVPHIAERGSLTFVSGTPARKCNPGMSSVSCTGSAVEGLTRALALEVAPIRVNAVAPGLIATGMFPTSAVEEMGKNILLGRVGDSEEVAAAIMLLIGNAYMTGTTIDVDGGILLP